MRYVMLAVFLFSLVSWSVLAAEKPSQAAKEATVELSTTLPADARPVTVAERRADNEEIGKALAWLRSELLHTGFVVRHMAESTPDGKAAFEAAEKAWQEKLVKEQSAQATMGAQAKRIEELEAELAKAKGEKADADKGR